MGDFIKCANFRLSGIWDVHKQCTMTSSLLNVMCLKTCNVFPAFKDHILSAHFRVFAHTWNYKKSLTDRVEKPTK